MADLLEDSGMDVKQVFTAYNQEEYQATGGYEFCPLCQARLVTREDEHIPRQKCPQCSFVHFINPAPAVSILILDGGQVLLGKRAAPPGQGKWALPSGYIEFEDDFLTTGIREAKEETGLDIEIHAIVNVVSSFISPRYHFLTIYLLAHPIGGELAAADDLEAASWFSLSGPLPEMAFEEDSLMLEWYCKTRPAGIPVDRDFASDRQ
jgi:ADP-ribose pyrophosphatase YjhB (NUDIX family)